VSAKDSRPQSIRAAVMCLRLSAAVAAVLTLLPLLGVLPLTGATAIATAITGFVTVGLLALVAAKINAGRGWARWLSAVIYTLGSFIFVLGSLLEPRTFSVLPTSSKVSAAVQFAIQTAALICVFLPGSRAWFARAAAKPESAL
jgi:hypothetical protein